MSDVEKIEADFVNFIQRFFPQDAKFVSKMDNTVISVAVTVQGDYDENGLLEAINGRLVDNTDDWDVIKGTTPTDIKGTVSTECRVEIHCTRLAF